MNDAEQVFVSGFRDGTWPVTAFHHRDHVHMAWLYVREFGAGDAAPHFVADLKRFAVAKGVPRLYHATITHAYLALVAERITRSPLDTWDAFATAHPDLLAWKPGVLDTYYSDARLWSDDARVQFLMPDKAPVPVVAR